MFQSKTKQIAAVVAAGTAAVAIAACGGSGDAEGESTANVSSAKGTTSAGSALPQGTERVKLDPAEFTTKIDNLYWPMSPGSRWVYRESDTTGTKERVVVEVTDKTKTIANGVEAVVVRDTVSDAATGDPLEVTDDWYAQDANGNIWYLGEDTAEYENGKIANRSGSFEAGIDGAQAGIALPANPEPGMEYRQEYYEGEVEDEGAIVTVGEEQVQVPFGHFDEGVLMTRDLVPTEPKVQELKFYVPDVGPVLSVHTDGVGGRGELVSYEPGR